MVDSPVAGQVHERDDEGSVRQEPSNQRRRPEVINNPPINDRTGIFRTKQPISMENIELIRSNIPGVNLRRPFNPISNLIPMNELISNGSRHGQNLMLIILSISSVAINAQTKYQQSRNGSKAHIDSVRHDRKMVVLCPLSPVNANTAIILFGSGCCERIFDGDISLRDNGAIRPGATILLVNPPGTDKFLAESSTPILMPQRPVVVINNNFFLPQRPIVTDGTDFNGFILLGCDIKVLSFDVRNTKCGGNLCDRQQDNISKCACYQMPNRSGNVIISIEVEIRTSNGSKFTTTFRSKWFLEQYIFNGYLPIGCRATLFEDYEVEDRLFSALENVMQYISRVSKFVVIGWVKRGQVVDQGVAQPGNGLQHNASRVMVQSGSLTHHVTRLDLMRPNLVCDEYLNTLKFNVSTGFTASS